MRKSLVFWLVYGVAWFILAASNFSFFYTHLGRSFPGAVKGALFNTLPPALFGIVVVMVCKRLPWSPSRRRVFLSAHLLLLSLYIAVWLTGSPFLNAVDQMIRNGNWNLNLAGAQSGIFSAVMIYLSTAGIVYAIQTNERLRAEEARATRAESLRTRAELEALRAQLNPHFLFNTLHSLMALVRHDPQAAEDELDFIHNYLALEHIRLGERLRIEEIIDADVLACQLPPFTLQPQVENSIKHAIAAQPEGGQVTIKAARRNGL